MAHEATLSVRFVRQVVEMVERAGVPAARFLHAAQLDPERLTAAEGRVPRSEFYRVCELALDLTQDESLALKGAEAATGAAANLVTHLVTHSTTLRQGLETLLHFQSLLGDEARFQLLEGEHEVTVRCASPEDATLRVRRFIGELEVVGFVRLIQYFSAGARLRQVCFEYPAPAHRSEYTRIFGAAERFDQPFTGVVFDRALMSACSLNKDEEVYGTLRAQADRRVSRVAQLTSHADRMREYLLQQAAPTQADMNGVARALGLSMRSLRRRLAEEGTSYNAVANDAFATLAKRMLSLEQRTIQETAYLLGYADSGAFHRAFKRWTGMTPGEFCTAAGRPNAARDS